MSNSRVVHEGFLTEVAYSPDGRYVASVGWQPTIHVYDLEKVSGTKKLDWANLSTVNWSCKVILYRVCGGGLMGRVKRADAAGCVYHMLNRANRRATIFRKDGDYQAFEKILDDAVRGYEIELFAYCLMPTHWHLVVRPRVDGEMSRFAQWLGLTHTQRYNAHYDTAGQGHLYQGRYKSFPVQDDDHFLSLCRYVERNAYTAGHCTAPDRWRYGSLWRWKHGGAQEKRLLSKWPISRRQNWVEWVAMALSDKETERLRWSIQRGCPFGDETWVESTARKYDLEMTMRPRGRPRKFAIPSNVT